MDHITDSKPSAGYVKMYRSLMDKGYYKDSAYVHLWLHLIFKATYQEKEYLFNGKIHHLQPGQFITGRKILVKETGINRSKIERILKTFKSEHQIEQQTFNKFRIISILNWTEYQASEQQNEQPVSNQCAQSIKIKKENKKDLFKIEAFELFDVFWKAYPKKQAKQTAIKAWNKIDFSNGTLELILSSIEKQKIYKEQLKRSGEFCPEWPMPSTWLNGHRWEDEVEPPADKIPDNYFTKVNI